MGDYSSEVPHFPQNFEPAGRLAPHLGQVLFAFCVVLLCITLVSFEIDGFLR